MGRFMGLCPQTDPHVKSRVHFSSALLICKLQYLSGIHVSKIETFVRFYAQKDIWRMGSTHICTPWEACCILPDRILTIVRTLQGKEDQGQKSVNEWFIKREGPNVVM